MRSAKKEGKCGDEQKFELKYCERCGALWLRPVGGGQVYCVTCARQIAELPPASYEARDPRMPRGPRWGTDDGDYEDNDEEVIDLDASGGVA
jgi:hypothetical protein